MVSLKRIRTTQTADYDFVEKLYLSAFPEEERREEISQREHTDCNPIFYNNIILCNDVPVGFISYWDFNEFYYIEHFAIDPEQRNGGFGHETLIYLEKELNRPIVLEVEMPTDEFSTRRINFYKRLGYDLWNNGYEQPPYRKHADYLPMHLMVLGGLDSQKDFERIKTKLYQEVYKVGQ